MIQEIKMGSRLFEALLITLFSNHLSVDSVFMLNQTRRGESIPFEHCKKKNLTVPIQRKTKDKRLNFLKLRG